MALYGLDVPDSAPIIGGFELFAVEADRTTTKSLLGYNNGDLTWCGNSLDKSAVVAESLGTNGYRKYASGLIEQWGVATSALGDSTIQVDFPISFSHSYSIVGNRIANNTSNQPYLTNVYNQNNTKATFFTNQTIPSSSNWTVHWIAKGY